MNPVPENLILRFAEEFASGRKGMKLEAIPDYFAQYQGNVPTLRSYVGSVTKPTAFKGCVLALSPENQRQALYDLCDCPPQATHPMPDSASRLALLALLVQADGTAPLGVELSALAVSGIRRQWMTAASRLPQQPSAAITAARALLESTCKTILHEMRETPDTSGDLGRLYRQVRAKLGTDPRQGASRAVHQMVNGLMQCVDGIAALSNAAGDRHGLVAGTKIDDVTFAGLCVHAAGTVSLFLARTYKDMIRGPNT